MNVEPSIERWQYHACEESHACFFMKPTYLSTYLFIHPFVTVLVELEVWHDVSRVDSVLDSKKLLTKLSVHEIT